MRSKRPENTESEDNNDAPTPSLRDVGEALAHRQGIQMIAAAAAAVGASLCDFTKKLNPPLLHK